MQRSEAEPQRSEARPRWNTDVILAQAWRSWQHARGVALLAAAALAIGIGAATAIYSVVNAVMLKPLPLPEGERFIALFEGNLLDPRRIGTLPRQDIEIFQQRNQSLDLFGWYRGSGSGGDWAASARQWCADQSPPPLRPSGDVVGR
jgi:hypothetical protein